MSAGGAPQSNRSDASIPATGPKRPRGSGQIPVYQPDADEPDNLPTLERMSSWDELPVRRGKSSEQAEMQWILMIVGRSVGAGVVILIVWIACSSIWKALSQPHLNGPPSPSSIVDQTSRPPTATIAPSVANRVIPSVAPRPKSVPVEDAPLSNENSADAMVGEDAAADDTAGLPSVAGVDSARDEPEMPVRENSPSNPPPDSESANVQSSPVLQATHDGVYLVLMEDAKDSHRIQVGTAWAASHRHLVTSAAVAMAIEEYQQQGMIALVLHPSSERTIRIKNIRLHDAYRKAAESADEAREKRNAKLLAAALENQLRFDLGVLDVGRTERLANPLPLFLEPLDGAKESPFFMVGFPFQKQDNAASDSFDVGPLKERRSKKPVTGLAPQGEDLALTIQFGANTNGQNWSGSPVLNGDYRVIGVFAQLPQPTIGKRGQPEHTVVWLGRLREFASDVE